jgi:hypothetical protein
MRPQVNFRQCCSILRQADFVQRLTWVFPRSFCGHYVRQIAQPLSFRSDVVHLRSLGSDAALDLIRVALMRSCRPPLFAIANSNP